ncbi:SIMPL domain-containing protein [Flavobacterium sediminilitoris]|uniref:SIMPL domain-containing protein n=1 Tax=Flavobacterium sediminilitoris TaxID=2024526 RepID=A0ABY4HPL8_9FLAO|nr:MULTISPECIES: SIMPL domain-containing protein [Flavobacterium]UOX33739.1 SIMPL domain-containing protein [Flavobacterium sediminilitoris]
MKNLKFTLAIALLLSLEIFAQHSGNANSETAKALSSGNYNSRNQYQNNQVNTIQTTTGNENEMYIQIKGIYNEKASSQRAVFSVLQIGKTAEETTKLMDERLENVIKQLTAFNAEIEIIIDMISFLPMYDYEIQKKIFNPKTYNEKPSGFELKKNLIIKYKKTNDLNTIMNVCAKQEIYDLAKVDYVTSNLDHIRDVLQTKAAEEYKQMLTNYSAIMNTDLFKKEKSLTEGYNTVYPMESYKNYTAYSQASINFAPESTVNNIRKNNTQFYDASLSKTHTFVVNADITEPTIQIFYDLIIKIKLKEDQLPKNTIIRNNRYYIITANGDVKPLNL